MERTEPSKLTRRRALTILTSAGIAGTGALISRRSPVGAQEPVPDTPPGTGPDGVVPDEPAGPPPPPEPARWSDPATWGGALPAAGDEVVVDRPVLLDADAEVAGLRIEPEGELVFDPDQSRTLTSTGNVEVAGAVRMRPSSPAVTHVLTFAGVDEAGYIGGHADAPLASDVGMWLTGQGLLDAAGAPKVPWTRLTTPAPAGVMLITVEDTTGWEVGDEVAVTPTEPPSVDRHWEHHDTRTITAIAGDQVALDRPLSHPHPAVTVREGVTHHAEVLNLSRNVRITGTPEGRAHVILLHNQAPQHLSHTELRHLGPRQGPDGVEGRYPLHFHMCEDGSRGSTLEGVVARDCGNHAFTTHLSHGVTWTGCVSHDTFEDPFWWDPVPEELRADGSVPTHDVVYDRCVAHRVKVGKATRYLTTGFFLGAGEGNVCRGCVAAGVEGDARSASGFHWPERSNDKTNTWVFEDNLAHNLKRSGIYFWQNVVPRTIVDRFTAYHCATGIYAGAYSNLVSYRDCTVYGCGEQGMLIAAVPERPRTHPEETITYERVHVDQAGMTPFAVEFPAPVVSSGRPVMLTGCTFKGGTQAQLGFVEENDEDGRMARHYELVDCVFEGNELWLGPDVSPQVVLRLMDEGLGELLVRPRGRRRGELRPAWNARVEPGR